jgi:hypothetical protein
VEPGKVAETRTFCGLFPELLVMKTKAENGVLMRRVDDQGQEATGKRIRGNFIERRLPQQVLVFYIA